MFVVKHTNKEIMAYCSRKQDAEVLANNKLDGHTYTVEEVKND